MTEAPERIVASVDWESILGHKMTMACVTVGTEGVPSPFEPTHYIRKDVSDARVKQAREEALREAAERIDRKIKQIQPEMSRRAQRLAAGKKPGFQYAIHRADLDARMSDRDAILALITEDQTNG